MNGYGIRFSVLTAVLVGVPASFGCHRAQHIQAMPLGGCVQPLPEPHGRVDIVEISLAPPPQSAAGQPLVASRRIELVYPAAALDARLHGNIVLGGALTDGGAVQSLWVIKGLAPILDLAALAGFRDATFPLPFVPDGRPRRFTATVAFRLVP